MNLSVKQIELLNTIRTKLVRGDIRKIAKKTKLSRVYVSNVLNPEVIDVFNEDIVDAAVKMIDAREVKVDGHLQKLTANI